MDFLVIVLFYQRRLREVRCNVGKVLPLTGPHSPDWDTKGRRVERQKGWGGVGVKTRGPGREVPGCSSSFFTGYRGSVFLPDVIVK